MYRKENCISEDKKREIDALPQLDFEKGGLTKMAAAADEFLNVECKECFGMIKANLFARKGTNCEPQFKAANHYEVRTKELGLVRLSTVLKQMADCVNAELGPPNPTLFINYWRQVSIELSSTRDAFNKLKE